MCWENFETSVSENIYGKGSSNYFSICKVSTKIHIEICQAIVKKSFNYSYIAILEKMSSTGFISYKFTGTRIYLKRHLVLIDMSLFYMILI